MMALVENLCLDPDTAKCRRLLSRLDLLYQRLKVWEGIDDNYFLCIRKGWYQIRVSHMLAASLSRSHTVLGTATGGPLHPFFAFPKTWFLIP